MLNQNEVTAKRKPVAAETELRHESLADVSSRLRGPQDIFISMKVCRLRFRPAQLDSGFCMRSASSHPRRWMYCLPASAE
jgi:hypothetical protein